MVFGDRAVQTCFEKSSTAKAKALVIISCAEMLGDILKVHIFSDLEPFEDDR